MINTLVLHKKRDLGIGCIAKEMKDSYKVNFGLVDSFSVKKYLVTVIDTSNCKTITAAQYRNRILDDNSTINYAIVGNELRHYVGIGWITHRVIELSDLEKYPRVV
jgi:hypothetical protein